MNATHRKWQPNDFWLSWGRRGGNAGLGTIHIGIGDIGGSRRILACRYGRVVPNDLNIDKQYCHPDFAWPWRVWLWGRGAGSPFLRWAWRFVWSCYFWLLRFQKPLNFDAELYFLKQIMCDWAMIFVYVNDPMTTFTFSIIFKWAAIQFLRF